MWKRHCDDVSTNLLLLYRYQTVADRVQLLLDVDHALHWVVGASRGSSSRRTRSDSIHNIAHARQSVAQITWLRSTSVTTNQIIAFTIFRWRQKKWIPQLFDQFKGHLLRLVQTIDVVTASKLGGVDRARGTTAGTDFVQYVVLLLYQVQHLT